MLIEVFVTKKIKMANCIVCSTELKSLNTPLFGNKTNDGGKICTKCSRKLALKGAEIARLSNKIKRHSTSEFLKELEKLQTEKDLKNQPLNELKEKIKKLNPSVVNKREVKELLTILMAGEEIEKIDSGMLKNGTGFTGNGLLVATNSRLIFIDKPTIGFGIKMEDFPYDKISSVSVETGFLKGELKLICSGNTATINLVMGAKIFSEFIRQKTSEKPQTITQQIAEPDILGQIEKLAELKNKGILTEEEFTSKKSELLGKI